MTGRNLLGVVATEEKESGVSEGVRAGLGRQWVGTKKG